LTIHLDAVSTQFACGKGCTDGQIAAASTALCSVAATTRVEQTGNYGLTTPAARRRTDREK